MFSKRSLFGGAASCEVPQDWIDVSTLRDVPDNQEVFVDRTGDVSAIVEILEYQKNVADKDAAVFFFNDLADADHAQSTQIDEVGEVVPWTLLPGTTGSCMIEIKGQQVKAKSGPGRDPTNVFVFISVFRAPSVNADILVTTHAASDLTEVHRRISQSLNFTDPHLFM
jgi:hypothetical protein